MKYMMILAVAVVACLWGADALASTHSTVPLADDSTQILLDIIKKVLDIIVQFIGDILDEFVRAIKDLISGGGGDNGNGSTPV